MAIGHADVVIGYFTNRGDTHRAGPYLSIEMVETHRSVRLRRRPISMLLADLFDFAIELILADRIVAIRFEPFNRRMARFVIKRVGGRIVGVFPYEYVMLDREQLLLTYHNMD
jgi:hypothetical protein